MVVIRESDTYLFYCRTQKMVETTDTNGNTYLRRETTRREGSEIKSNTQPLKDLQPLHFADLLMGECMEREN